jgi:hypothetical protein
MQKGSVEPSFLNMFASPAGILCEQTLEIASIDAIYTYGTYQFSLACPPQVPFWPES